MPEPAPTGWVLMGGLRGKFHFIGPDGRSLCGRWLAFDSQPREQGMDESPDNCAECKRRKAKATAKETTDAH